jgi:CBS domain-containing protein
VVGLGGLLDPRVLGAGYTNIQDLLDGSLTFRLVLVLLVIKAAVWLVALGSGTSGGVLAPLLILGGALGSLIGSVLPGGSGLWAMVGMAAIMSGAMRAPMTGALFAVELTGHLGALPLVMAASAGAYALSVLLMRRSILTEKIARRGRHIVQEYSVDSHEFLQVSQIMTPDPATMRGDMPVEQAIAIFAGNASHRSYPVVDAEGHLLGLVSRSDALRWQVDGAPPGASLADLLSDAEQPFALPHAPIGEVADLIIETGIGRIPIVDPVSRRVVGIASRHDLLKGRRARIEMEQIRSR